MDAQTPRTETIETLNGAATEKADAGAAEPYTPVGGATVVSGGAEAPPLAAANDNDETPPPASPGARVTSDSLLDGAAFQDLVAFVRHEMPILNTAIRKGNADVATLVARATTVLPTADIKRSLDLANPSMTAARAILQPLGFVVSSVERHSQQAGQQPGDGLAQLTGVEPLLVALGVVGKHPPRDSYRTYWLNNAGQDPLTFTGNPQEVYFNKAVNMTAQNLSEAVMLLRDLRVGMLAFDWKAAAQACDAACTLVTDLIGVYRNYRMIDTRTGKPNLEPDFFMTEMRQYLLTYPVGGRDVQGPNATYSPAWALCDLALGNRDLRFIDVLCKRQPWIIGEDWDSLAVDFKLMAVPELLMARLGFTAAKVLTLTDHELRQAAAAAGSDAVQALVAYARLADAHRMLSATHWALIVNYLLKPSERLDAALLDALPVKPNRGVSATPVEATRISNEERRNNPLNRKLIDSFARGPVS